MTAIPLPIISAPGRHPQASGGRLINTMVEKLGETAGSKLIYWRVPGLKAFGTTTETNFRGGITVINTAYVVIGDKVFTFSSAGGAGTALTGTVPGTAPVFLARNNASTPDIVLVSPGDGAFVIAAGAVSAYPDVDVGQPNSVVFHKGFFVFTYGDGTTRTSGVNSTSINTLDKATAESRPDELYRAQPLGNGQIMLWGSESGEVWGGANDTGYPFSYIATISRGLIGRNALCGHEAGFGKGIFLVGDDGRVHLLNGYAPEAISTPDIDGLIKNVVDKDTLILACYMDRGHAFVVLQSSAWCWEYDVDLGAWHERQSYEKSYWRGRLPFKAFNRWLCGDTETGNVVEIDGNVGNELNTPLRMRIETGPFGDFPHRLRVRQLDLYLTKGVGIATGHDPEQTKPQIEVSMSPDGGNHWQVPRLADVGEQAITGLRVCKHNFGMAEPQGVRWRFDFAADVPLGFMAADMTAIVIAPFRGT